MSVVDILVTIIVVTILVTIVLAVVTYVAYKLRLARRPVPTEAPEGPHYFDIPAPPAEEPARAKSGGSEEDRGREAAIQPDPPASLGGNQPEPVGRPVPVSRMSGTDDGA